MAEFLLSVRMREITHEIGMSQRLNAWKKNRKISLTIRMPEMQGNQRSNAERKK